MIQNIQQKQYNIEQQIIQFVKSLISYKNNNTTRKDTSLTQLLNSLNDINSEIIRLLQTYLSLLRREYLTEDHIYIIQKEMNRSIKILYDFPDLNYDMYETERDKLIAICQTYLGL